MKWGSTRSWLSRAVYVIIVATDAVTETGSRCVTTNVASGNVARSTGNCSMC